LGLKALFIPTDSHMFANNGCGIADSFSQVNPASIVDSKNNRLSFSQNYWLSGIKGNSVQHYWKNSGVKITTYSVDDIELWDEIPNESPVGKISARWYDLSIAHGMKIKNYSVGIELRNIYSQLYTQTTQGFVGKIGLRMDLIDRLSLGAYISNFGYVDSQLDESLPLEFGSGISCKFFNSIISADYIKNDLINSVIKTSIQIPLDFFHIVGGYSKFDSNEYFSGGVQLNYRHWGISYSILKQDVNTLGTPQAFQLTLRY
jgi:hypothetical protein